MQDKTDETDTDSEPKVKEEMEVEVDEATITGVLVEEKNPLEIKKEEPSESETTDQSTPSTECKEKKVEEDETAEEKASTNKLKRKRRWRKRPNKVQRKAGPQEYQTESSNSGVVEEEALEPVVMETTVKIEPQVRVQEDVEYVLTVSNMPNTWTYMDIKNYIDTEIEPVDEMELVKDEKTGKGAIRLSYQSEEQCKSAMGKLQSKEIEGNKLTVEMTDTMKERLYRRQEQLQKKLRQLKLQRQRNIKLMQIKEKLHVARMAYLRSKIKSMENYSKTFKKSKGNLHDMLDFSELFPDSSLSSTLSTLAFVSRHSYLSSSSSTSSSSEEELEDREVVKLNPKREEERESEESSEERESDDSEDTEEESSKIETTEEERESSEEEMEESIEDETEPSEEYVSSEEGRPIRKQAKNLSKERTSFEDSDVSGEKERESSKEEEKRSSREEEIEVSKEEERESSKEKERESSNEGEESANEEVV